LVDLAAIRVQCDTLMRRLDGRPSWPELRAIYLEVAPLIGRLQASVGEAAREPDRTEAAAEAEAALGRVKASAQKVGLDIRLASERALQVGLQMCLEQALEVVDRLEGAETK
jgi:hypothetical protein